ncbi:hypothetical protein DQ239_17930 [Blastococcus sp. TF02-09]|uniref:hypothetical protein n=1 Tax=Blastococcus sp. TF02-09 TaxID=2250576 RepID=UPI000DE881F3|nr:hypothetical protein [Blastococcus sp. TF02-9]RBY75208.1 hypothetical protein DQ239_17930 [Blastococcus sp. TF02-9]
MSGRPWHVVGLVYGPLGLLLAGLTLWVGDGRVLTVGGEDTTVTLADLVQEPAVAADLPPWTGALGLLGGVTMVAAGAVAVAIALGGVAPDRGARADVRALLRDVGLLTVALGADDLLQLHEAVVPALTGLPEKVVFAGYLFAAAAIAVGHRAVLRRLLTPTAALALCWLATSVAIDVLDPGLRWHAWTEDSMKLLGLAGWSVTVVSWALSWSHAGTTTQLRAADEGHPYRREAVYAHGRRVDGVAWGTSEQQRTHGRTGHPTGTAGENSTCTTGTTPVTSPAEPVPPTGTSRTRLDRRVGVHRKLNGNTRGHPGAVQEADPQPRVRAVESE